MADKERAPREEIFGRLSGLIDTHAVEIAQLVAKQYIAGEKDTALLTLKKYDATLGGVGIYRGGGKKLPGIYRALSYNEIPMLHGHAHESGRSMIHASGAYLEELIKKLVWIWPWENFDADPLPLGVLIWRIEKRLPEDLARELRWLNSNVHVYAKHYYNMTRRDIYAKEPEHYFEMDEAIAVYFIARVLGTRLEKLSGKPQSAFLDGWLLPEWGGELQS